MSRSGCFFQNTMDMILRTVTLVLLSMVSLDALANEARIVGADFQQDKKGTWTVSVALLHNDEGWEHYADAWRVVDAEGNVLGERVLLHPHENEQPFTRSATGVKIPDTLSTVYIEAHDKVHGWTPNRLQVNMSEAEAGRIQIMALD